MIAQDPYGRALQNIQQVNFEGDAPWEKWTPHDLDAILAMFGTSNATDNDGDEDVGVDRQSNVPGGRYLFALSQSKANPYRFSRIQAQNGSFVPVIPMSLLTGNLCASVGGLLRHIRVNIMMRTNKWTAFDNVPLTDLWRMAPHQNWAGTLPERRISKGEAEFFRKRRDQHAYAMNEWQVRVASGKTVCAFGRALVSDVGAVRFVSVTGRRILAANNWSYVEPRGEERSPGFKGKTDTPSNSGLRRYHTPAGATYDQAQGVRKKEVETRSGVKEKPFGKPPGERSDASKAFSVQLHDRQPVRFYFSLNHYRSIAFNVRGRVVGLNPWFAIVDTE